MTRRLAWLLTVGVLALGSALAAARFVPEMTGRLASEGVELARPALLTLGLLAWLPVALAPWSLTDLPRWQQGLQALLRAGLVLLLVLAAAGPRTLREQPLPARVVHLIDRSESVPDVLLQAAGAGAVETLALARSRRAATLVEAGPPAPPVAVVAFDRRAVTLPWPPTATQEAELPADPSPTRDPATGAGTDLAAALNLALGLFDGHAVPHVVVWSDGVETRGDALRLVPALQAAGVRVHTPRLPALPPPAEVLVERFELPAKVRAGVNFPVAVVVQSTSMSTVSCQAEAPGSRTAKLAPVVQQVPAGATRVDLGTLRLSEPGPAELAARCQVLVGRDRFLTNNHLRARVVVEARPRVLYVEGAVGQSAYLTRALVDNFAVETRAADGLPRTLAELRQYQAIVLSDVARVSPSGVPLLTDGDMRNLEAYARAGGGLLVLGGENSLGSGGYQDTYLDKHVLPVRMDVDSAVEAPTLALVLAVDKSGSMQGQKMELAKEAARATAEALAHEDRIGVVAFDSDAQVAVRLQRAGNRYKIATDIARLAPSGGTHIYPALEQSYQMLLTAQAKVKHVILMTDGQAPRSGIDALVRQMRRSGITVSSVGVGTDVDRSLLESIADRGGGRSYFTDRPETLPRIFVRETKLVTGESVVEQVVRAQRVQGTGRLDLLRGVPVETAPVLTGFLPTRAKPGATELLRLSTGQPLLVRWRLGTGKVSVWTSDLKNRWAARWLDWPGYAVLARQMVRDVLQEELGMQVAVQLHRENDQLRVAVDAVDEDGTWLTGLHGQAEVRGPEGQKQTVPLPEVAPGRYETAVPMRELGAWDVHATLRAAADKPVLASGRATAIHPYPDEHRLPEPGSDVLQALVAATGGKSGSGPADWLDAGGKTHRGWQWLWPDLVRAALVLLLVDVLLRRVRLGRAKAVRWHALRRPR